MGRTMKRATMLVAMLAGLAGSIGAAEATAAVPATSGSGSAEVASIACPSAGNCVAVGYQRPLGHNDVFVMNQVAGVWGNAKKISLAALPKNGSTGGELNSVSCASPGSCSAGGAYRDRTGIWRPFAVNEKNGTWGKAQEIPGISSANLGGLVEPAGIEFISCPAAGDCTAVGHYFHGDGIPGQQRVFVVSEADGNWGRGKDLPGMATLTKVGADFTSLSCSGVGNCAAGGAYFGPHGGSTQAFVASQTNGTWGRALEVPGTAAVNTSGGAITQSVSCPSSGDCVAAGYYISKTWHPFVSVRTDGTWSPILTLPLPPGAGSATLNFVWCASAGNCEAVGDYNNEGLTADDFFVIEKNGTWGSEKKIPLGANPTTIIGPVVCTSIGNCSAGGGLRGKKSLEVFVDSQVNGTWGKAAEVRDSVALNHGAFSGLTALACGAAGDCTAGGFLSPSLNREWPFLVTQENGTWGKAKVVAGLP